MAHKTCIHAIFPNYCSGAWVSYTLMSLLDNMRGADTDTGLMPRVHPTIVRQIKQLRMMGRPSRIRNSAGSRPV